MGVEDEYVNSLIVQLHFVWIIQEGRDKRVGLCTCHYSEGYVNAQVYVFAKQYDLGKKCVCGGSALSYPIAPSDILDILPLVKHAASLAGESFSPCSFSGSNPVGSNTTLHILLDDVRTMHGIAQANLNNRNYDAVVEY